MKHFSFESTVSINETTYQVNSSHENKWCIYVLRPGQKHCVLELGSMQIIEPNPLRSLTGV